MAKISVFLNGRARQTDQGATVAAVVESLGLEPRTLLAEHNGRALHRHEWPLVRLEHGDRVELLRVSAGG